MGRDDVDKLVLIPVVEGKSTTATLEKLKKSEQAEQAAQANRTDRTDRTKKLEQEDSISSLIVTQRLNDSIALKEQLLTDKRTLALILALADKIKECLREGNKLVLCGNGGSASDALHFAGEIVGRFQMERAAWPAVVLNADVATMTAISNDYGYKYLFARQAEAHIKENDIFIGISTSGNSENVLEAVKVAQGKGAITAGLLGRDGGKIAKEVDYPIIVPCNVTARVQEVHICIIHILCELVETSLAATVAATADGGLQ